MTSRANQEYSLAMQSQFCKILGTSLYLVAKFGIAVIEMNFPKVSLVFIGVFFFLLFGVCVIPDKFEDYTRKP